MKKNKERKHMRYKSKDKKRKGKKLKHIQKDEGNQSEQRIIRNKMGRRNRTKQ